MMYNVIQSSNNANEEYNKKFASELTKMFNDVILIQYPDAKSFSIEQGFFTSEQYGSYRIPISDKDKNMICYVIFDLILGEYKLYSGSYE